MELLNWWYTVAPYVLVVGVSYFALKGMLLTFRDLLAANRLRKGRIQGKRIR